MILKVGSPAPAEPGVDSSLDPQFNDNLMRDRKPEAPS